MNVLITGGTGGIGFAVAEHFGRLGHHVILADINSSQLDSRQQELTAAGYKASSILLNLMDQSSIEACAQAYQCRSAACSTAGRFP
jgi:3-hydroxybutyrate dehydrogenase